MTLTNFKNKLKELASAIRRNNSITQSLTIDEMKEETDNTLKLIRSLLERNPDISYIQNNTLYLPEGVTSLLSNCFSSRNDNVSYQKNLTLHLPNSLIAIYGGVFSGSAFDYIVVSENTRIIGEACFFNSKIKNFIVPYKGLNTNGNSFKQRTFEGCQNLTEIFNFEKLRYQTIIPTRLFYNSGLTSIILPDNVITLDNFCFAYCKIVNIDLPSSIKNLNLFCLANTSLKKINIPHGTEKIIRAFYEDSALTTVSLPNTLITVDRPFENCPNLEFVTLENDFNISLDLSSSTKYSADTIVAWFNALKDNSNETTTNTLTIGQSNLEKLTSEQIAIATNKNWTLA